MRNQFEGTSYGGNRPLRSDELGRLVEQRRKHVGALSTGMSEALEVQRSSGTESNPEEVDNFPERWKQFKDLERRYMDLQGELRHHLTVKIDYNERALKLLGKRPHTPENEIEELRTELASLYSLRGEATAFLQSIVEKRNKIWELQQVSSSDGNSAKKIEALQAEIKKAFEEIEKIDARLQAS